MEELPTSAEDVDVFAEDPSSEGEDDLQQPTPGTVSEAVVTGTDWTAETILSQLARGNIELNPRFQRRDAWTDTRKSRFIESLILGLPIPQLVLAEHRDQRGSYLVIDGKQRLLALRRFSAEPDGDFEPLTLRGLEVRSDLNGLDLGALGDDAGYAGDLAAFENQTIRTVVVRAWPDEDFLFRVFLRLNTGSVPLSPQELRQALHPGPFIDFADDFSSESDAIRTALNLTKPDFRMRDVELLIRFLGFEWFLDQYNGNLKAFLDSTCSELNAAWTNDEAVIRADAAKCDAGINTTLAIFGEGAFRRYSNGRFEGRFNRAVFDIMVFYFSEPEVAEAAERAGPEVVSAFQTLCRRSTRFVEAITATTKSIGATHRRLASWGSALDRVLEDVQVAVPRLEDSRIKLLA